MSITRREFVKAAVAATGGASAARMARGLPSSPKASFSTGGHTVYHLRPARVNQSTGPVAITACYDGMVLCYTADGKRLWEARTGSYFPFDLCVADIDDDGLDEALVASADGALYAIDHDGNPLWTFRRTPPLYQVSVAKSGGERVVIAGGVEQVLYELSAEGKLLRQISTQSCIRHVRAGDIRGEGRDYVAVTLASSGLTGELSLLLVDPRNFSVLWQKDNLGSFAPNSGRRFFSMTITDVDGDGKQDIVLSDSWGEHGKIFAFNHEGNPIWTRSDPQIPNVPYRMNLLNPARLPQEEFLIGLFANMLILYNQDGSLRETLTCRYDFANGAFDPATRTFWLGSSTSGGDDVHCLHLDRSGWRKSFERTHAVGKLAKLERNMEVLKTQIARFRPPVYQPATRKTEVLLLDEYNVLPPEALRPWDMKYRNVRFVSQMTRLGLKSGGLAVPSSSAVMICQKVDKGEFWSRKSDVRQRYDLSAEKIVAAARDWESRGKDFLLGAAHGGAVYMPLSTFERVLQAAPKHLWGFDFSEMQGTSQRVQEVVEQILFPLAEMCRRYGGKKIVFRNKDIFWNGTAYVPFWDRVLLDSRYKDIFVPDMEETNARTQELSLAGRVGLWITGVFDHWGCRVETDNACFDRMWEWSSQQVLSHHFRQMVSRASYGAEIHYNSIHQGPFSAALLQQIFPFYEMLEKGIVYIPKPDELVSVSDVCLGMRTPPSAEYIAHGGNGHRYTYPEERQAPEMVFDRLDCYWAASPIPAHDFSYYAYGLRRRMTNFLPPLPYGLVAIVPDSARSQEKGRFAQKIVTDGGSFYDDGGVRHAASEYKSTVELALRQAARRLPLRVAGAAHWAAARLGPKHVRITLIDPGYLDPDDHDVEIVFQHLNPIRCTDILSGENIPFSTGKAVVRVPMGTLRILDVEHGKVQ